MSQETFGGKYSTCVHTGSAHCLISCSVKPDKHKYDEKIRRDKEEFCITSQEAEDAAHKAEDR